MSQEEEVFDIQVQFFKFTGKTFILRAPVFQCKNQALENMNLSELCRRGRMEDMKQGQFTSTEGEAA